MNRTLFGILALCGAFSLGGCGNRSESPTGPSNSERTINVTGDLTFGNVSLFTTSSRILRITNASTATVTITSLSGPSQEFVASWGGGAIAAGASQEVTLSFTPREDKSYSGTLKVNGDHTGGTDTLAIVATGVLTGVQFALFGTVYESAPTPSTPIPGAKVTIVGGINDGASVVANGVGFYYFGPIYGGDFSLRAEAAGYDSSTTPVHLNANRGIALSLRSTSRLN